MSGEKTSHILEQVRFVTKILDNFMKFTLLESYLASHFCNHLTLVDFCCIVIMISLCCFHYIRIIPKKSIDQCSKQIKNTRIIIHLWRHFLCKTYLNHFFNSLKLRCDSHFQRAFTACSCAFKVIVLIGSNQGNYFINTQLHAVKAF